MTDREYIQSILDKASAGQVSPDSMTGKLVRFWKWCSAGFCRIRSRSGKVVALIPNNAQAMIHAAMLRQAEAGKPVRLVVLKARKRGISTWVQALGVFLVAHYPQVQCKTLAHVNDATKEIFGIAKQIASAYSPIVPLPDTQTGIVNPAMASWYRCYTAEGKAVGAGGTPTLLHRSELAWWGSKKEETDKSSGESVPNELSTIIVDESTANGRDLFFTRFSDAADPNHPFAPVFIPWYVDEDCQIEVDRPLDRTEEERKLIARARKEGLELSDAALMWRRVKTLEIGEADFRQQYPSTPSEAVQGRRGLVLTNIRDCLVRDLPFDPSAILPTQRVGGIDFGYADATVIWSGFYVDQVLWLTDYWRGVNTLADEQAQALRTGHTYYCDPSGMQARQELNKAANLRGIRCVLACAPRVKNVGEDTATEEIKAVIRLKDQERLKISVHAAPQLIVECDTLAWNEKTGRIDDKRSDECGHYDSIMSLKYAVMGIEGGDALRNLKRPEHRVSRAKEWARV